jgi:hypothetical protein
MIDRSKGDTVIDYRQSSEAIVQGFRDAIKDHGGKVEYAFDAVSEKGSYQNICHVLDQSSGKITLVLPGKKYESIPTGVEKTTTTVGSVHGFPDDLKDFGSVAFRYIGKGLEEGWFKPQPHEVVEGGLGGVETGLTRLKEGKANAVKLVYKIEDTEGVGS